MSNAENQTPSPESHLSKDYEPPESRLSKGQQPTLILWDRSNMTLNSSHANIRANVRNSIRRQLPQFRPFEENREPIIIVGGGWSLNHTIEELRDLVFRGAKICALNGAANWLVEHNFRPSMHVIIDSREVNTSFIKYNVPGCKYFLASQCHPALFDALEDRDVTIFHLICTKSELEKKRLDTYYRHQWIEVPTSGTVGIVSSLLCRMLGFRFQHWFGIDSCYGPDGKDHSYVQPWNSTDGYADFEFAGRKFKCTAWQASQAGEFLDMLKTCGDELVLSIHGDGVLAHLLKTGYEEAIMADKETTA